MDGPKLEEPIAVRDETAEISSGYGALTGLANETQEKEYKRPKQDLLRDYELTIRFLSVGCVVRVGCKEVPFECVDRAMQEVADYVRDPHTSTEKWNKIFNQ